MLKKISTLFGNKLTLLVTGFLFLNTLSVQSQTDYSIGTGTVGNTGTTYPAPLQDWYEGSRMQFLYRASELTAAGMNSGNIIAIKYNVTNLNTFSGDIPQMRIKIAQLPTASLGTNTWENVPLTVFGPVNYVPTLGINTFTFPAPFLWNGTDNIVIEICNGDPGNAGFTDYTNNVTVPWTTGLAFNGSHSYRADDLGNLCNTTTTTNTGTQTTRPNITFTWMPDVDCAGTPVAGTASANPTIVCLGQTITLTTTGSTSAGGLSYQWQDSIPGSSGFTNIVGGTTKTFGTTQLVTTWYRLKIKCSFSNDSSYSNAIQVISPPVPGGVYTINKGAPTNWPGGTNFASFNDAYNAIKCGISAPTTFNVVAGSGPYSEQLIINGKIPNSSPTNTITFNGNNNVIQFAPTNATERAVIKLKGAKYFIFDSLQVDASAGTYGIGFHLLNDADSNIIRRCTIYSSTTNITAGSTAGIAISGADNSAEAVGPALCDVNRISNNKIIGGYYGVTLTATFAGGANGNNIIENNSITDFYRYGIFVKASYNTIIEQNRISRPTRTTLGAFDGIYFNTQSNTAHIFRNRIFSPFKANTTNTNISTGINLDNASASAGNDYLIDNNLIYDFVSNGAQVGLGNTSTGNVQYVHNTVALADDLSSSTTTTRGYSQTGTAASIVLINNLFSISRGGTGTKHCIYLTTLPVFADNNNYDMSAASGTQNHIGFFTANRNTLAQWQAATAQDATSITVPPVFFQPNPASDTSNYSPTNAAMDNKGFPIGFNYDIKNSPRDPNTPDIGCYEFVPPPCVPGSLNGTTTVRIFGVKVAGDTTICENTEIRLGVDVVGPYGSSQTFQWQRVKTLAGTPETLGSPMVLPDTIFSTNDTSYYFRCKISCLGTDFFTNWRKISSIPAMPVGNYTINSGSPSNYTFGVAGGNFQTYDTAVRAMRFCGIKGSPGNVVFNVVPLSGPYYEQVKIDTVMGATPTRQVVFKGNNTTLAFPPGQPTLSAERAVIKLTRADFINFDSLVIDASTAPNFGYGVHLLNNADSNSVTNSTILVNPTSVGQNFGGIVVNAVDAGIINTGNTLCDGNNFSNNKISGGYYGIVLAGGTSAATQITDNIISNNTISDFYNTGIYVAGTRNTNISKNTISRPTRTPVSLGYGIYFTAAQSLNCNISENRFTSFYGGAPTGNTGTYGIYFNNIDATTGNENRVINNAFYNLDGIGVVYALYNNGSDNVLYYHNSIAIDNPGAAAIGASAGFYQTVLASGIQFKNNIISINRGGTAFKYGINLTTPTTAGSIEFNNNIYFIDPSSSNGFIGALNGNRATLSEWQNAFTPAQDLQSFNYDPIYTNTSTGDLKPQFYLIDNQGANLGVTTDILNVTRSATPDIGAWEFTAATCPTPLVAGTASVTPSSGICLEVPIQLNLTGNSSLGTINFQWQDSIAGGTWQNLGPLKYSPVYDTVSSIRNFYRCKVTCAQSGVFVYSTVAQLTLNTIMPAGTYTIDSAMATNYTGIAGQNFNTFKEAITAMSCGILGSVVFDVKKGTYVERVTVPYVPGTSSTKTITFQGFGGISSDKIVRWGTTYFDTNYVLKYDGCTYVTFKNLTLENTATLYGRVVEFGSNSSNNSILNCNIKAQSVVSTTNAQAAVYSNPTNGTNITIKGNTINNGSNGIYFAGTSAANLTKPGHLIDSNTVTGSFGTGIFVQFTNRMVVTRNSVNYNAASGAGIAGIYANYCDTSLNLSNNKISISNTTGATNGIQLVNSRNTTATGVAKVNGNQVYANSNNTGTINGLYITSSDGVDVLNNVVGINSASATGAFGITNFNNINNIKYYHNSVNVTATSTTSAAAQLTQSVAGNFVLKNNIFSNTGGGRAMFMNNISNFSSDYNMLYVTGTNLVYGGTTGYADINAWRAAVGADKWSLVYPPAFVSNTDLRPNLSSPDVWAIHGRGIQNKGYTSDINGNYRPDSLLVGAPDLGAYEFFPTSQPTVLTAIPAVPAANTEQTFYLGSDTVMRIKWDLNPPPSVEVRRFSGVVPTGLGAQARPDSMYFYTQVTTPGTTTYTADVKLYYIDPWLGSIPSVASEYQLGLGKTTAGNSWIVGFSSRNDVPKKLIYQNSVTYLNKFTGMFNQYAPPFIPEKETSNKGKEFWVAYPRTSSGVTETYQLYLSATEPAYVKVDIDCINFHRTYNIPANTVVVSDIIPLTAKQINSGIFCSGIHITSDVPIVTYSHVWGSASSGAGMLLPTGTWGYEYRMLGQTQAYGGNNYSFFYVIAKEDNTKVHIEPTVSVQAPAISTPHDIILNKGEWYQVLASSQTEELSGSLITSVVNSDGKCFPIAVFSGSSRTQNPVPCSSGGDFFMTQNFPGTAWGKNYLTAPTSSSTGANVLQGNLFRIGLKDPTTNVWINNVQVYPAIPPTLPTGIFNLTYNAAGQFIQFTSNTGTANSTVASTVNANYIRADRPITVAQFLGGGCAGVGDPSTMYISPIEQGINSIAFYRNTTQAITVNALTLIGSSTDVPKIIDGVGTVPNRAWDYQYDHPNYPGKRVYVARWQPSAATQVRVFGDSSFTAITYGLGSVESYGYNAGTLVKNLVSTGDSLQNGGDPIEPDIKTIYNCSETPFLITTKFPVLPDSIRWKISGIPGMSPAQDYVWNKFTGPAPVGSLLPNGDSSYKFTLPSYYTINQPGFYTLAVVWYHPDIEGCDKTTTDAQYIQVIPSPKIDFSFTPTTICPNTNVTFNAVTADPTTGILVDLWRWNSNPYGISVANDSTINFTYTSAGLDTVKLRVRTTDGCVGDTMHTVLINPNPVVTVVSDSVHVCAGSNASVSISSPIAGATYGIYSSPTGGTALASGNGTSPFNFPNMNADSIIYIGCVSSTGCESVSRKMVKIQVTQKPIPTATPTSLTRCIGTSATFDVTSPASNGTYTWYDVATGGTALGTGNSFTVNPVTTSGNYYVQASVNGCVSDNRFMVSLTAATPPSLTLASTTVTVCSGEQATFTITSPTTGATYNWYAAATGGTALFTGTSYVINPATASTTYYVSGTSTEGCTTSPRTAVTLTVNQKPVVTVVAPATASVCKGSTHIFTVQSPISGATYNWYNAAAGGTLVAGNTTTFTTPPVNGAASYYVEGVSNGCTSISRATVSVDTLVVLAKTVVTADTIFTNTITFRWNAVPSAIGYEISVNGGSYVTPSSGSTGLNHVLNGLSPNEKYKATVKALGPNACQNSISDTAYGKTIANQSYYPNAFTPNGDGKNDKMVICGSSVKELRYMVFNQWGEKIWETTTPNQDANGCYILWDGTHKGKLQPNGVYIYTSRLVFLDGKVEEKTGTINLVR
ncbi:MAG: gliding motility-associated C-terminal domain-containing protein [Chitinophagaceae bacterium]|nr:gliding motility-associated C-terminal domain-containing protein [Chitinophagaceae bacterium]